MSTNNDEIVCNGHVIILPSLEVAKDIPKMMPSNNIDWLVHLFYARRDFQRCNVLIERELYRQLNPEYLYFVKGLIEREMGNNIEALRNLQKALEFNKKNIEIHKEIGRTLFRMGRFNQAICVFREAEQLSPCADYEIFHFIGELLHRSARTQSLQEKAIEDITEAKSYFLKAVQCGKKLESFQRLAEIYRKEKAYDKAIEVLENCLQLSPENTEVLTEMGVLYLKVAETQKAYDRLLDVINLDEECDKGLLAFGAILQSRNDIDGALGKYDQVAAIAPTMPELWNNVGLCFFKKQKHIAAIASLRKSIWLSPLSYNALYNISLIYVTAQQYASAFHTLSAAISLRKESAECYMLLGICLRKLGDLDNAYNTLERATEIASKNSEPSRYPIVYLNFALFCYEIERFAVAALQLKRFYADTMNVTLPTELKFAATKLKSLLRISTGSNDFTEDASCSVGTLATSTSATTSIPPAATAAISKKMIATTTAGGDPKRHLNGANDLLVTTTQADLPFDVHAVVNNMANTAYLPHNHTQMSE